VRTTATILILAAAAWSQPTPDELLGRKKPAKQAPSNPASPAPKATVKPATSGWTTHTNPNGFKMDHPTGWTVEFGNHPSTKLPVIRAKGPDPRLFAVLLPFQGRNIASARVWLSTSFDDVFAGWFPSPARAQHQQLQRSPDTLLTSFDFTTSRGPGRAAVLTYLMRGSGMVYAIAAPADQFPAWKANLVRILASFRFAQASKEDTTPAQSAQAVALDYVSFQDSTEGAFTVQVPRGWKVNGGVARKFSTVAPAMYLEMVSPNGVRVFFGDADIPPFTEPQGMVMPMAVGSWYSPGYGTRMMVMPYQHGVQFAESYLQRTMSRALGQVRVVNRDDQTNQLAAMERAANQGGLARIRYTGGEIAFESAQGIGTVGAVTQLTSMPSISAGGLWNVQALWGWSASREQAAVANTAIQHLGNTFRINPQWMAASLRHTAEVSRIVTETNAQISQIISDSYWSRQRSLDRTNRKFSDYIRGVQRVRDPDTGEEFEAVAGSNFYWRIPGGQHPFGTESTGVETVLDVRPLEKVD
jgi:hypothetical protein